MKHAAHRKYKISALVIAPLIALVLLFDWNWLRRPLEMYVSHKTQRTFRLSHLDVDLSLTPTIRMRDVYFSNAAWGKEQAMAAIDMLEFSISLRDLPSQVFIPRVALTNAELLLERLPDDRKNWILAEPTATQTSTPLRISSLSVNKGHLRYVDHGLPFEVDVDAATFDPERKADATDADAAPKNDHYAARFKFKGAYRDAKFSGHALTGDVLSFQESGIAFPIKGELLAGNTQLSVEGTIADLATISGIDARIHIQGKTLANLYPFLLLPLPASPPYELQGRLILKGDRYAIDDLNGKIGSTDVQGQAAYVQRNPRPLLTAKLHSKLLDVADLGPLVGVQTKETQGKPEASQAETADRNAAKSQQKAADPSHILPSGSFDGSRLQKIDVEAELNAAQLKSLHALPLEDLHAALRLQDAVLTLDPLEFGFAGGRIASHIALDAKQKMIGSKVDVRIRQVKVSQLTPPGAEKIAQGAGVIGGSVQIKGEGNSIADAAAKADGAISVAISHGRISNLLDAASGLNGGKVLKLLAGGDQTIPVNCGGAHFDIKDGRGVASLFVIDTEQTQILGSGGFDLAQETFDFTITPKPKKMGILSLRTPVHARGTFADPQVSLEKTPLIAKAGTALALATLTPLAALLPLIETGPGQDTDCTQLQPPSKPKPKPTPKAQAR